jgi:hypothetical protein
MSAQPELLSGPQVQAQAADLEVLFNTNDYVDLSALDNTATTPNYRLPVSLLGEIRTWDSNLQGMDIRTKLVVVGKLR